jgi:hypothetical protein
MAIRVAALDAGCPPPDAAEIARHRCLEYALANRTAIPDLPVHSTDVLRSSIRVTYTVWDHIPRLCRSHGHLDGVAPRRRLQRHQGRTRFAHPHLGRSPTSSSSSRVTTSSTCRCRSRWTPWPDYSPYLGDVGDMSSVGVAGSGQGRAACCRSFVWFVGCDSRRVVCARTNTQPSGKETKK